MLKKLLWKKFVSLPFEFQEPITELVLSITGSKALAQMLGRLFICFGADYWEVFETVKDAKTLTGLISKFFDLGLKWEDIARISEEKGHIATAKEAYRKAAIYYGVEAWLAFNRTALKEAYIDINRCYDKFRLYNSEPIYKVDIPYKSGKLPGFFRPSNNQSELSPCIVIIQGYDTIKEWLEPIEKKAIERGFATLNIDIPGNGESLLRNFTLESPYDALELKKAIIQFLKTRKEINLNKLVIFGFSLGGYLAIIMASEGEDFKGCAVMGSPFNFEFLDHLTPLQFRRIAFATAQNSIQELKEYLYGYDLSHHLPNLNAPLLIVHGGEDELIPVRHAELLYNYSKEPKELIIYEEQDHMLSKILYTQVIPYIFDWLSDCISG